MKNAALSYGKTAFSKLASRHLISQRLSVNIEKL
jgi:hypothetical protein